MQNNPQISESAMNLDVLSNLYELKNNKPLIETIQQNKQRIRAKSTKKPGFRNEEGEQHKNTMSVTGVRGE